MFADKDLQQTIRAFSTKGEGPTPNSGTLKMGLPDFDKNPALKYDFNLKSGC